jgi:hypothetical protein
MMASEDYKGFHIIAWARAEYGNGSASVGIVCKPTRLGSIVEVKRIEGRSFENKEEAERHGLELCKQWIDKQRVEREPPFLPLQLIHAPGSGLPGLQGGLQLHHLADPPPAP